MDYPIKTLGQLRPILQGFRKAAGLTQAMMASHLGVTQQTYAQLEANPAAVSVDRLFKVLRVLDVDLTLTQTAVRPKQDGGAGMIVPPSPGGMPAGDRLAAARPARTASAVDAGHEKRTLEHPRKKETAAKRTSATTTRKSSGDTGPATRRSARKSGGVIRKRENW